MSGGVITDPSQLTAQRVAQALRSSGALTAGTVTSFDVEMGESTWSRHARLHLHCTPDARGSHPGDPPRHLFLKMCQGTFGDSEVHYYRRDYAGLADMPLLRCHDAAYRSEPRAYHLLLDDVSATHRSFLGEVPPAWLLPELADAVAALHAAHRGPDAWLAIHATTLGEAVAARGAAHEPEGLEPLLCLISGEQRQRCERLLREACEHVPRLMLQRCADPRGLFVIHGDINGGNILGARDEGLHAGHRPVYLIDRQPFDGSAGVLPGPSDLAYLMCSHWPTEARRTHQQAMLERYHAGLVARGVDDYAWPQLEADYRLCVLSALFVPINWCAEESDRERMRWLWTSQLERALEAVDELDAAALWRGSA